MNFPRSPSWEVVELELQPKSSTHSPLCRLATTTCPEQPLRLSDRLGCFHWMMDKLSKSRGNMAPNPILFPLFLPQPRAKAAFTWAHSSHYPTSVSVMGAEHMYRQCIRTFHSAQTYYYDFSEPIPIRPASASLF